MRVEQFERFQKDLSAYKEKLKKLPENKQKIATQLITQLVQNVKLIDQQHDSHFGGYANPKNIRENVEKSIDIRMAIEKLFKDANL